MDLQNKRQSGFSAFEAVFVVAVVAIIALAGYTVYNRNHKSSTNSNTPTSQTSSTSKVSSAPDINTTSDLDKALTVLNQNDPGTANNSDSSQLDTQLSGF